MSIKQPLGHSTTVAWGLPRQISGHSHVLRWKGLKVGNAKDACSQPSCAYYFSSLDIHKPAWHMSSDLLFRLFHPTDNDLLSKKSLLTIDQTWPTTKLKRSLNLSLYLATHNLPVPPTTRNLSLPAFSTSTMRASLTGAYKSSTLTNEHLSIASMRTVVASSAQSRISGSMKLLPIPRSPRLPSTPFPAIST